MALVALLRRDGPQTATQAAKATGQSVASCSFHLRQMAKYGLVEQAGGGRGREKPWRSTAMFTDWDAGSPDDPVAAEAAQALQLALAEQYFELLARWLHAQTREPAEWREAAQFGDTMLHLTAAELRRPGRQDPEARAAVPGAARGPLHAACGLAADHAPASGIPYPGHRFTERDQARDHRRRQAYRRQQRTSRAPALPATHCGHRPRRQRWRLRHLRLANP